MSSSVIAIGLDALAPELFERWIAAGELPFLARLMAAGTYARQQNFSLYRTENSWLTLLQGCSAEVSHEWGHQTYDEGNYQAKENPTYRFEKFPPFYALDSGKRVAVFDIPLTGLVDGVNGVQLLGWGTEVNQIRRESLPAELIDEVTQRHGPHPLYDMVISAEDGAEMLFYRMPCIYDIEQLRSVRDTLFDAIAARLRILRELLAAERWDLLICAFGELHIAGHLFWHIGRDHPLAAPYREAAGSDFLLDVLKEIDHALSELADDLPPDANLVVFSPHGMQANSLDLYSMLFLPELLYRWSTGEAAFPSASNDGPPLAPRTDFSRHWSKEVWDLRSAHGNAVLESPEVQEARGDPLDWDPANWYQPLWPKLKAFVLPGYSEGLIRINVAGRDGDGGIAPEDYDATCAELVDLVMALTDARTGDPLVDQVVRVRETPFADSQERSPADLMILWRERFCTDVADHPSHGRIGPIPFFRSGGHATEGFMLGVGPSFDSGVRLPTINTADVTATLLDRMGVTPPPHIAGKPVDKSKVTA